MNTPLRRVPILILASAGALLADPSAGDTRAAVIAELGEPSAKLMIGPHETLLYPRGKIVLENAVVKSVGLKSVEQFRIEEARRAEEEKAKREEQVRRAAEAAKRAETRAAEAAKEAEAFAARKKIADEALAKITDDPKWATLSPDDRLDALARFAKKYPDADIAFEKSLANRKLAKEQSERLRIDELEARIAAAERRAEAAEARAKSAESGARDAESRAANAESRVVEQQTRMNEDAFRLAQQPVIIRERVIVTEHGRNANVCPSPQQTPTKPNVIVVSTPTKPVVVVRQPQPVRRELEKTDPRNPAKPDGSR